MRKTSRAERMSKYIQARDQAEIGGKVFMKKTLQLALAAIVLLAGLVTAAAAQDSSGTINTLTVNPRQNQELTNSTGTETGQPSDVVPGSESQPNGLVPVTTKMMGSGSNGNMTQSTPGSKPPSAKAAAPMPRAQTNAPQTEKAAEAKNKPKK